MLYAFILLVSQTAQTDSEFVIDYNLTAQDCTQLVESWSQTIDKHSHVYCIAQNPE